MKLEARLKYCKKRLFCIAIKTENFCHSLLKNI
jgi:hypothetical protein